MPDEDGGSFLVKAGLGLYMFIQFAWMLAMVTAFIEGLSVWFEFGTAASIFSFILAFMIGPLGTVAMAVIGYVGATDGWQWPWWQAALLCFPGLIFMAMSMFGYGVASVFSLFRR